MVFMLSMVMVQTCFWIAFYLYFWSLWPRKFSQNDPQEITGISTRIFLQNCTFRYPKMHQKSLKITPWAPSGLQMPPGTHNIPNHLQKPSKIEPKTYKNNPESGIPIPKPLRSRGRRQGRSLRIYIYIYIYIIYTNRTIVRPLPVGLP